MYAQKRQLAQSLIQLRQASEEACGSRLSARSDPQAILQTIETQAVDHQKTCEMVSRFKSVTDELKKEAEARSKALTQQANIATQQANIAAQKKPWVAPGSAAECQKLAQSSMAVNTAYYYDLCVSDPPSRAALKNLKTAAPNKRGPAALPPPSPFTESGCNWYGGSRRPDQRCWIIGVTTSDCDDMKGQIAEDGRLQILRARSTRAQRAAEAGFGPRTPTRIHHRSAMATWTSAGRAPSRRGPLPAATTCCISRPRRTARAHCAPHFAKALNGPCERAAPPSGSGRAPKKRQYSRASSATGEPTRCAAMTAGWPNKMTSSRKTRRPAMPALDAGPSTAPLRETATRHKAGPVGN